MLNWDDPSERAALIDRVGPAEYERLHREMVESDILVGPIVILIGDAEFLEAL